MENENQTEGSTGTGTTKQWMQDNLRIILSVIIVILIAGGIYSYSKRTATPSADQSQTSNQAAVINPDNTSGVTPQTTDNGTPQVNNAGTSQETETALIESASKGDGMTVLARRALANYLEKNPDSTLTPEHKIYIEDFLRKNVPQKRVFVGTSAEFSKNLIQNAITKAKALSGGQLKNLHKYAVRVPSLS